MACSTLLSCSFRCCKVRFFSLSVCFLLVKACFLSLPAGAATPTAATETSSQPWPAGLAQQMQAVRGLVQQATQPLSSAQVAARFWGSSIKKVQPLLDTLALMALVRFVEKENKYAA
jgi:hypothetical protein